MPVIKKCNSRPSDSFLHVFLVFGKWQGTPCKHLTNKGTVIIHLIRTSELSEFDVSEIQKSELSERTN